MNTIISTIVGFSLNLLFISASYAAGCTSLDNTTWTGHAKLITRAIVPINVIVTKAIKVTDGFYDLKGTINGETITGMFGCTEFTPGSMQQINFANNSISISSSTLLPNASTPTRLQALSGRLQGSYIDTTTDPTNNYLVRSN